MYTGKLGQSPSHLAKTEDVRGSDVVDIVVDDTVVVVVTVVVLGVVVIVVVVVGALVVAVEVVVLGSSLPSPSSCA